MLVHRVGGIDELGHVEAAVVVGQVEQTRCNLILLISWTIFLQLEFSCFRKFLVWAVSGQVEQTRGNLILLALELTSWDTFFATGIFLFGGQVE